MDEQMFSQTQQASTLFKQRAPTKPRWQFLRRQLRPEATLAQIIFDVTVGMILPILCLVFDPIVFRRNGFGAPVFSSFQFFAYGLIALEVIALGVWLAAGERAGEWCGVLGGMMLAGACFSLVVGICLLPLSLIGLMFGIGIFGFTPFLTAFIYWRNARRALKGAGALMARTAVFLTLALGALVPLGVPAFAQWRVARVIERSLPEVLNGSDAQADAAARRLGYLSLFSSDQFEQVVWAYSSETDPARRKRLAHLYREMTGDDIERRLAVLND